LKSEERILKGSNELFRRYGIKSVTMDDIAKHLGISKKTIYQAYADKKELVNALTKEVLLVHINSMNSMAQQSTNAIEEIINMMNYMGHEFAGINPNMFYDMQRHHPEAWIEFRNFKENSVMQCVVQNLEKGKEQLLYRKDLNNKIIARLRLEQVELAFNPAVFPPDKYNLSQVHVELLDHFLHGICTIKGHKLINKYRQIHEEE
jgi:TetR/AcrR family transcriptional regulator, cholesterol catabolism regulator